MSDVIRVVGDRAFFLGIICLLGLLSVVLFGLVVRAHIIERRLRKQLKNYEREDR